MAECGRAGSWWGQPADSGISNWDCGRRWFHARSGDRLDATRDLAVGEAGEESLAGSDLGGGADERSVVAVEGQAVAAAEDGQGAEGLEAGGEPGQAEAAVVEGVSEGQAGAIGQVVEAVAGVVEPGLAGGAEALDRIPSSAILPGRSLESRPGAMDGCRGASDNAGSLPLKRSTRASSGIRWGLDSLE
jgi:hypothetical protein